MIHPGFAGSIGSSRIDITPPVGIRAKNWGASAHDVAEGIHDRLTATIVTLQADGDPLVLISADLGWWRSSKAEAAVRKPLLDRLGLDEARLILALTHTHAGPTLSLDEDDLPGGCKLRPYLAWLSEVLSSAVEEALAHAPKNALEWATGRCGLATDRDLIDGDRFVCGFNPSGQPDDSLLVGRISGGGCLVNYACHPTSLGPDNRLLSSDFVGAMRAQVERPKAPCVYLQGASGELAPRDQYKSEPSSAEQNGSVLGFAVLSVLTGMLPPQSQLQYGGVRESGAPLAIWELIARELPRNLDARILEIGLALKDWPITQENDDRLGANTDEAQRERLRRQSLVRRNVGEGRSTIVRVWLWQAGETFFIGLPGEAYSLFQRRLRAAFPDRAVVCMNVANGWLGYFPPAERYSEDMYSVRQTPFAAGSLERLIEGCEEALRQWTN